MKRRVTQISHWLLGSLVAFSGVLLARHPFAPGAHPWLEVAGLLIAGAGLGLIALGVRRRIDRPHDSHHN